jgi:hypothetical protein
MVEKMSEKNTQLKLPRRYATRVTRRGGGLYTLLPSELANFLDVGEGDKLVYIKDVENKTVLMLNPERIKVMVEGIGPAELSFLLPKKFLEKIKSKDG